MKKKNKAGGEYEAAIEALKRGEKAAGGKKVTAQALRPRWKIVIPCLLALWVLGFLLGLWAGGFIR